MPTQLRARVTAKEHRLRERLLEFPLPCKWIEDTYNQKKKRKLTHLHAENDGKIFNYKNAKSTTTKSQTHSDIQGNYTKQGEDVFPGIFSVKEEKGP
ncbi:Trna:M(4)X Modification Enzyme Trm13-like [Manis pentadactyla]|nr:Trna:M(4)X Modification Enzyme Trm13-like [Manis pentadactyla]